MKDAVWLLKKLLINIFENIDQYIFENIDQY